MRFFFCCCCCCVVLLVVVILVSGLDGAVSLPILISFLVSFTCVMIDNFEKRFCQWSLRRQKQSYRKYNLWVSILFCFFYLYFLFFVLFCFKFIVNKLNIRYWTKTWTTSKVSRYHNR